MARFRIGEETQAEASESDVGSETLQLRRRTTGSPDDGNADDGNAGAEPMRLRRPRNPAPVWDPPRVADRPSFWRVLSWLYCLALYAAIGYGATLAMGMTSQDPNVGWAAVLVVFGAIMALSASLYNYEKSLRHSLVESVRGEALFVLYGRKLDEYVVTVPLDIEWEQGGGEAFLERLKDALSTGLRERIGIWSVGGRSRRTLTYRAEVSPLDVQSKDGYGDHKEFVRVYFETTRGSALFALVHGTLAGKTAVLHVLTRLRGKHAWHDVVNFVLKSPVTIWYWFRPWHKGSLSILTWIGRLSDSPFELMDLQSVFSALQRALHSTLEAFLRSEGFTDEQVGQVINVINNHQNFNISHSQNVSGIGNLLGGGGGLRQSNPRSTG